MPQVRDPKTGRYTSGGGSSVGGASSTNPRIQKAAAVGNGATAGAGGTREQARALEKKASALERELNMEMSSTGEGKHSVGWRREQQKEIERLRSEASDLLYGSVVTSTVQNTKNASYDTATKMFSAKQGTVIQLTQHTSGDYVGEYTRTSKGWSGSQKYGSSYAKPADVTTANGFAMRVQGMDVKVLKQG